MNVLVFGLGHHNGGSSAAMYYARRNYKVTVTDIKSADEFKDSMSSLNEAGVILHLGEHVEDDFLSADIVIKNPAIHPDNNFLTLTTHITTDIIELLNLLKRFPHAHIIVISGTKGKSSTTNTVTHVLRNVGFRVYMGGNIGISGFTLIEEIESLDADSHFYVVLELSSWQIRDLCAYGDDIDVVFDSIIITSLYPDHGDYYNGIDSYYREKLQLLSFNARHRYVSLQASEVIKSLSIDAEYVSVKDVITTFLVDVGLERGVIQHALHSVTGLSHRQEVVKSTGCISWINDSSATIPEAMNYTLSMITTPYILIFGGSDKSCDIEASLGYMQKAVHLILLDGSFTQSKIIPFLHSLAISFSGPFTTMNGAVLEGYQRAKEFGKPISVVLSPGAASFGIFTNSDERGNVFKECVLQLS